jgi:hypothetical protein
MATSPISRTCDCQQASGATPNSSVRQQLVHGSSRGPQLNHLARLAHEPFALCRVVAREWWSANLHLRSHAFSGQVGGVRA